MRKLLGITFVSVLALAGCESGIEGDAKEAVRKKLLDPESARFRNLKINPHPGPPTAVCGEVNAKNRMGGYVGFAKFVFVNGANEVMIDPQNSISSAVEIGDFDAARQSLAFMKFELEHCLD